MHVFSDLLLLAWSIPVAIIYLGMLLAWLAVFDLLGVAWNILSQIGPRSPGKELHRDTSD